MDLGATDDCVLATGQNSGPPLNKEGKMVGLREEQDKGAAINIAWPRSEPGASTVFC